MAGKHEKMRRREKPEFDPSKRAFLGFALKGLTSAAVLGAAGFFGRRALVALGEKKALENVMPFDPEKYAPPSEGVIIEKQIFDPTARTVIIIPDRHPDPNMSTESNKDSIVAQKEIFAIVTAMINEYGKVPLVQEGLTPNVNFDYLKNNPAAKSYPILPRIAGIENENDRVEALNNYVRNYPDPIMIALLLIAAYPEKILPIPTISIEGLKKMVELKGQFDAVSKLTTTDGITCTQDPKSTSTVAALYIFDMGDRSAPIVDCVCKVKKTVTEVIDKFSEDRFINAPRAEARIAIEQNKGHFSALVAGEDHLYESLRVLQESKTNYIIVAPKSFAAEVKNGYKIPHHLEVDWHPDTEKVCK